MEKTKHKTYELSPQFKGIVILLLCGVTFIAISQDYSTHSIPHYLMLAVGWAFFLFQIYKIELIQDRYLIFHRVIKKTRVEIKDIISGVDGIRYYRLYHKSGSVYLDQQIDGLESFKRKIKKLCPEMNQEETTGKNLHKDIFGIGFMGYYLFFGILIIALFLFIGFKLFNSL